MLFLLAMLPAPATAAVSYETRFQSLLDSAVSDGLPGVSLGIRGLGIDFAAAAGVADIVTGEPLTVNHRMYIASLGKTFTATIALQLYDEARLDLDDPVTSWLPDRVTKRIPLSDAITLRHLLSHRSGIHDYMNDAVAWRADFMSDAGRDWTHSDIVSYLYDRPLLFEPGSEFEYSNSNYILAGMIIEKITGQPLHALIRKRILAPLGLKHTINGKQRAYNEHSAHGYVIRRGRMIDTYPWFGHYGLADSGIQSTPGDMTLFAESLFSTGKLLSKRMRAEMIDVVMTGQSHSGYGMGIYVQQNPWGAGLRWYSHDGIDPGYQADLMYLPDFDLSIVLAANASMGKADRVYAKLVSDVVRLVLEAVRDYQSVNQ
jgi:D-alanyl-D-alanine carboxypeptidase